jgi:hypothetical protein
MSVKEWLTEMKKEYSIESKMNDFVAISASLSKEYELNSDS